MNRGNFILNRLFSNSVHSIRRLAANDSEAKAMYRFLQNDHVSEEDRWAGFSYTSGFCNRCRKLYALWLLYYKDLEQIT